MNEPNNKPATKEQQHPTIPNEPTGDTGYDEEDEQWLESTIFDT